MCFKLLHCPCRTLWWWENGFVPAKKPQDEHQEAVNCETKPFLIIFLTWRCCVSACKLSISMQIEFGDAEKWFGIVSSLRVELCWAFLSGNQFLWKGIRLKSKLFNDHFLISSPPTPKPQWGWENVLIIIDLVAKYCRFSRLFISQYIILPMAPL